MKQMKKWLGTLFVGFLALVLAACSGNSGVADNNGGSGEEGGSGDSSEITLWAPFSGPDGPYMKEIVDGYNDSQEEYTVDFQIVPQTEYYKNVDLAINGEKNMPDVMIMHGDQIFTYAEKDVLRNMDDIMGDQISEEEYHPSAIEGASVNGELYGVPLDIHPLLFYWNKDMFEAAGLDPEQPPTNRDEFIEYAQKLTDKENNQWGYAVPTLWPQEFIFPTIVNQNGGELYKDGEVQFTSDAVVEALQFEKSLIEEYEVSPKDVQQDGEVTLFLQGKSAMQLNGPWMLEQWEESGINYGVAPVPQLGTEQEGVYANSHNFVIPQNTDDAKLDAITDFLSYVGDNAISWAESGQAPASKAVYESDEFQEVNEQSSQVAKQFDYVSFAPDVDNWGLATSPLMEAVNVALLGQKDVKEALEEAQQKASQALEE
ncbi:ABC transporter substrate-binding protein [Sediminibacillus halophilus]|uniref:Multiple sugar transport system substrate-binding protein n=1 Tax=Sediminibacillus halophilus TaxID=482461 RepID=A0A1G9RV61_9BACI|nr:ABC transporter substrate-binding protein [Sediminibacillus halophilus]SDM26395.1 multiple sugar transport system substrate-binding protein [Sediminibacillus halophilus]